VAGGLIFGVLPDQEHVMAGVRRLPARFPVGTHYVVEGVPDKEGELLITSRYVVLPNGIQVPLPVSSERPVRPRRRPTRAKRSAQA
jgi:hypothetical protein